MSSRLLTAVLGVALVTSACAAGGGAPSTSDAPRRDLAVRPTPLGADPTGSTPGATSSPGPTQASRPPSSGVDPQASSHAGSSGPSGAAPRPSAPYHRFADLADGAGDAGLGSPGYADLLSVALAGNGANLRVTVILAEDFPARTADDETIGIGVDLYRPGTGRESDFQLFADGEPDGWFAYLQTPNGFVRYPGTFALGGQRLVFTVPWSAVGNPTSGRFSAFVDWTRRASGVAGNDASNDYAPTLGTRDYTR